MSWPDPRPGLVVRYAYLWRREATTGQEEGLKDRPCAIILAVKTEDGQIMTYVLPITHSPPETAEDGVELPGPTKARLGLDSQRSWIMLTEANVFAWPGPDLRPAPGKGPDSAALGMLPPGLLRIVKDRFVARVKNRRLSGVKRTD